MTLVDERLTVRKSRAHVRFVEDFTFALKEAEPSKAALEDALKDQIGHGRRLLEIAEVACYLASVKQLHSDTHKDMEWALAMGVRAFRDLYEMVADWTRRHGVSLEGAQDLGPLVSELESCRAEMTFASQQGQGNSGVDLTTFPQPGTAMWGQMNRRRAELIRKNIRGELSEEERKEYEELQRLSLAAVDSVCIRG